MILLLPVITPELHDTVKFWLEILDQFVKVTALIIGATWSYITYRRGRTFSHKLEPEVSGHLIVKGNLYVLSLICTVKNFGLSKVPVEQEGTVCQIYALTVDRPDPSSDSEPDDLLSVFLDQEWIEPGEVISDPHMMIIDFYTPELIGIRINLRMSSRGSVWTANCIVDVADLDEPRFDRS